jgi:hypothetical protein
MVKGVMKKTNRCMQDVVPVLSRSSCAGVIPKQLSQNLSKLLTSIFYFHLCFLLCKWYPVLLTLRIFIPFYLWFCSASEFLT